MRILWVCPTLLHPTINGSQVRTLGILRHLSRKNELHFVGTARHGQTTQPEADYCSKAFAFPLDPPKRASVQFALDAVLNTLSDTPLNVARYASAPARKCVEGLLGRHHYDAVVVDFLLSVPNVPSLANTVLFQHNVEARIMERLAAEASSAPRRAYLSYLQRRLERYERDVCRRVKHVLTVSPTDSAYIQEHYGVDSTPIPTGVNIEHFEPREGGAKATPSADLVFVGSLDYLPNVEGVHWFAAHVLPRIHQARPNTTVALVGKKPVASICALGEKDPRIQVTGTVPDVRPYLWSGGVSIVPLFAGSGTRLKIYEAMGAALPVISTTVGAEGLVCANGTEIILADEPAAFAKACLDLLADPDRRASIGQAGHALVKSRFDWSAVAAQFQQTLERVIGAGQLAGARPAPGK